MEPPRPRDGPPLPLGPEGFGPSGFGATPWAPREPCIRGSVLETIGWTPLVRLARANPHAARGVDLLAKLEGHEPLGSVKERVALAMVEAAEREGRLRPGMTIVESSSGNTGIGLAAVAAVKGYRLLVTMSAKQSVERRRILAALGAEVVLTSAEGGSDGAWDEADRIAESDPGRYCRLCQYHEAANPAAHARTTAEEVYAQAGGRVDCFVAGLGTTGTIVGCGRRLKELLPRCRVVAVEPVPGHRQEGLRNIHVSRVPTIYDPSVVDETIATSDEEAVRLTRDLARLEGIFAGVSSGSALAGAIRAAERLPGGSVVVVLFPDRGEKYLSTGVFADP